MNIVQLPHAGPWWQQLKANKSGDYMSNLHNSLIELRHDPVLAGGFAFDEFAVKPIVLESPPRALTARAATPTRTRAGSGACWRWRTGW